MSHSKSFAVVFGIIIDTFSTLRDAAREKREDMNGVCFICGIDRETFDRNGNGFAAHTESEHNVRPAVPDVDDVMRVCVRALVCDMSTLCLLSQLWDYAFLMVYLRGRPITIMSALELSIANRVEQRDVSWFPIQKVANVLAYAVPGSAYSRQCHAGDVFGPLESQIGI